jgi:hypothetical protein
MIVVAGETPFDGRGQLRAVFMLEIVIPTGRRIQHLDLQRGYPQGRTWFAIRRQQGSRSRMSSWRRDRP